MPDLEHCNALKLTWSPCENANSYEIYQARVQGDSVEEYKKVKTVSSNECQVFHLYNENTYRFKIKALGQNSQSSIFSAWKSGVVPAATNTSKEKAVYIENGSIVLKNDFDFTDASLWNTASFSDCINPGESYLLRIKSNECIQIIVE